MSKEWVKKSKVRARHIEEGLCRDCTDSAEPGKKSCARHLSFAVLRKRRWRIRHGFQKPK